MGFFDKKEEKFDEDGLPIESPPPNDLDRLMQLQKDYEGKKQLWGAIGSAADTLTNRPTVASIMLKRPDGQGHGYQDLAEKAAGENPGESMKGTLAAYSALKGGQDDVANRDPTSQVSANKRKSARAILQSVNPEMANAIDESMSGAEVDAMAKEGLAGKAISGSLSLQGRQVTSDRMKDRNDIMREGLGLRKGNQAAAAAGAFDNDTLIKSGVEQKQKLDQASHTLESPVITPQIFAEIQTDIATAIAKGGSNAASQEQKKEFKTLEIDLANFKQKISGKPQDINSPEARKYLKSVIGRLNEAYDINLQKRADQIAEGRSYNSNPEAQATVKAKVGRFKKAAPASGPKAGDVEDGHRFKGGDPSNPGNWEEN